jgi:hypothetical protein
MKRKIFFAQLGEDKELVAQNSDEMKQFVSKLKSVPPENLILILPNGKEAADNFSLTMNTFYIFSKDFREKQKEVSPPPSFQDLIKYDPKILEPSQNYNEILTKYDQQLKISQKIQDQAQVRYLDSTISQYYQKIKREGLSILISNLQILYGDYKQNLEIFKKEITEYNNFVNLVNLEKDKKVLQNTLVDPCFVDGKDETFLLDFVKDIDGDEQYTHCRRFIRK